MDVLFLTQIVPYPPDAGPKVKTYHVLRALDGQGHNVTLVTFARPEEMQHIPVLEKQLAAVHAVPIRRSRLADVGYMMQSFLTGDPFLIVRDNLPAMQDTVARLVRQNHYDILHADQLTMVQFALQAAGMPSSGKPAVVFDAHNAVWTIVERMEKNASWYLKPILRIEAGRVKRYEGGLLRRVDNVLAVTDVDKACLEEAIQETDSPTGEKTAPITVIPIAVDTQQLQPVRRQQGSKNIVTLGTLHYPPNADGIRWFMNEVFPLVRQRVPEATLTVIGKNPPRDFVEQAEKHPDVITVTGYVPELTPYFEQSALMVVPVRAGGGMRVRILEAFAYAMPVVTTTVGLEGIHAECGSEVIVADDPAEFAAQVCSLLDDEARQAELAMNGRRLAENRYDWQVVLSRMEEVYGSQRSD